MYVRYSSSNQREESIDAQIKAIEEYCRIKGYIVVKIYADEAKTATTDDRPNFQKMIEESAYEIFDFVIVHKLDRFARNRYDSAFYKRMLKINKVTVESVLERLDDSPESIILESVLEGMAEYFSKNLAREVRKGLSENADKALHNGGRPPYGLKVNPATRQYEIDETRCKAVQIYFDGVNKGIPLAEIARSINLAGFRTYTGDLFKITSFDTWAYNRKYRGDYTWNVATSKTDDGKRNGHSKKPIEEQTIISGAIPAIIQPELWDRVNALMKKRQRIGGSMTAKNIYLLSNKATCGQCNANYFGESYMSRGNKYAYYKCSGKCGQKGVAKEALEDAVIEALLKICFSPEGMLDIAGKVKVLFEKRKQGVAGEIDTIQKEISQLANRINNWLDIIGEGTTDRHLFAKKISEASEKKTFLESQLSQIMAMEATQTIEESVIIKVLEQKKSLLFSSTEEDKKQVVQEYVDKVVINDSEKDSANIEVFVRCFDGGGEGICTPVSKSNHKSVYACVL